MSIWSDYRYAGLSHREEQEAQEADHAFEEATMKRAVAILGLPPDTEFLYFLTAALDEVERLRPINPSC
jgi:hypothetical protein